MLPILHELRNRWQNRKFAQQLARRCQGSLLILLSTRQNIKIVRQLARLQPLWITNGPIVAQEFSGLNPDYLKSTNEIVRLCAGQSRLPRIVISFPDQLVGDGPSFTELEFAGAKRHMSLFELLLVKRQQPNVFTIKPAARSSNTLHVIENTMEPGSSMQTCLARLLQSIESELQQPPIDWLSAAIFQRKTLTAASARFRDEIQDVEALLRVLLSTGRVAIPPIRQILERLDKLGLNAPELHAR